MNEKIKLLAEQAEDYVESLGLVPDYWQTYSEKFAELIVRDCIGAVVSVPLPNEYEQRCADAVRQHFGVEE